MRRLGLTVSVEGFLRAGLLTVGVEPRARLRRGAPALRVASC